MAYGGETSDWNAPVWPRSRARRIVVARYRRLGAGGGSSGDSAEQFGGGSECQAEAGAPRICAPDAATRSGRVVARPV